MQDIWVVLCVCVGGGKLAQNLQINCGHSSSFLFLGKGLERSVHACARYSLQSSYNVICSNSSENVYQACCSGKNMANVQRKMCLTISPYHKGLCRSILHNFVVKTSHGTPLWRPTVILFISLPMHLWVYTAPRNTVLQPWLMH